MVPHIIYLISHGHTARGAFQTNLLKKLVDAGNRVTVITSSDPDGELKRQVSVQGAELAFYSPPRNRLLKQLNIFRSHVHQNIEQNPALWEKHQRRMIDHNSSFQRRAINSFYFRLGDQVRRHQWLKRRFLRWEQKQYEDPEAVKILSQLNPDVIISTRPVDSMEAFLLNAARRLEVLRIMYLLSWDNITTKGFFPETADRYLTWGPVMNAELKEFYGVQENQVFLTGVTHFDVHHEMKQSPKTAFYLEQLGLNGRQPYIFFTMSASYYAPNEIDIVEHLAKRVKDGAFGPDMQLVVRPHMANLMGDRSDQSWLARLEKLNSDRIKVNFPNADNALLAWYMATDDMLRLSALIHGASVCLNSGSTVAIEALYLDKPVVITAFDTEQQKPWNSAGRVMEYEHLRKLFATSACKLTNDLDGMESAIQDYLANPHLDAAERQIAVKLQCYQNDGQATSRFVANLERILGRS